MLNTAQPPRAAAAANELREGVGSLRGDAAADLRRQVVDVRVKVGADVPVRRPRLIH